MADLELSMDALEEAQTSNEIVQQAQGAPMSGTYTARVFSAKIMQVPEDRMYNPGRIYFQIAASLHTEDGGKVGKAFFRISHVAGHKKDGGLDIQSRMYADAALALDMSPRDPKALMAALKSGEAEFEVWGKLSFREKDSWDKVYVDEGEDAVVANCQALNMIAEFNVFSLRRASESGGASF